MAKPKTHLDQHTAYSSLYNFFNERLFGGELAPVMLNFSRHAKAFGFFVAERWVASDTDARSKTPGSGTRMHEISLNPDYLVRDARDTCGTLVHEMVHAWQAQHGKPGRGGYHNAQWAAKMKELGLHPSDTAQPGGREVGERVSHYIIADGRFARAFKALPKSYQLPLVAPPIDAKERKAKPASKVKYTCPSCEANAWGKPGLLLVCGEDECDGAAYLPGEATG